MSTTDNRSVAELFTDALNQFSKLVRNELQLARKELSFKAGEAMTAVGLLACAGLFLIPALVMLLAALAAWMEELGTGRVGRSPYCRRSGTCDRCHSRRHRHEPAQGKLTGSTEDLQPNSTRCRCRKGACVNDRRPVLHKWTGWPFGRRA